MLSHELGDVQQVADGVEETAEDEPDEDAVEAVAVQYPRMPVHLSLSQAACALRLGLIRVLDGRSVAQLRCGGGQSTAADTSASRRLLYLRSQRADADEQERAAVSQPLLSSSTSTEGPSLPSTSPASFSLAYPAHSTAAIASSHFAHQPLAFTLPILLCSPPAPAISSPSLLHPPSPPVAHALVFADLYARGFTLTSASQYGGHLLLYDGDPSSCHAHSIVRVVERQGTRRGDEKEGAEKQRTGLSGMELLAMARVGSAVRKSVVLAWVEEDGDALTMPAVRYLTCRWEAGLSNRLNRHSATSR